MRAGLQLPMEGILLAANGSAKKVPPGRPGHSRLAKEDRKSTATTGGNQ